MAKRIPRPRPKSVVQPGDPAATNDASQGFQYFSLWKNSDTGELFVCMDPTTGAAVWKELAAGTGGGAHVDTRDPAATDDQTKGFDAGEFWFNTDKREQWVCIDAATGAAKWRNVSEFAQHTLFYAGKIVAPPGSDFADSVAKYTSIQQAVNDARAESPNFSLIYLLPGSYDEDVTISGGGTVIINELKLRNWATPDGAFHVSTNWSTQLSLKPTTGQLDVTVVGTVGFMGRTGQETIRINPDGDNNNCFFTTYGSRLFSRGAGAKIFTFNEPVGKVSVVECFKTSIECGYEGAPTYKYTGQVAQLGSGGGFSLMSLSGCRVIGDPDASVPVIEMVGDGCWINVENPYGGASLAEDAYIRGQVKIAAGATGVFVAFDVAGLIAVNGTIPHIVVDGSITDGGGLTEAYAYGTLSPLRIGGANAGQIAENPQTYDGGQWRYRDLAGQAKQWELVRNNYTDTGPPTVDDDYSEGYRVGSWWMNTVTEELYVCHDATDGAAVWREAGGGAVVVETRDPVATDDAGEGNQTGSFWLNVANRTLWISIDDTDDAAVWWNHNNLAHLWPYLVGPVGLAPYQTIQSAVDAAPAGGRIYVIPGTFNENVTISKNDLRIHTAWFNGPPILTTPGWQANVVINGTVTVSGIAGFAQLGLDGIRINAPSGSSALTVNPPAGAIAWVVIGNCRFETTDAEVIRDATKLGFGVLWLLSRSVVSRSYSTAAGPAAIMSSLIDEINLFESQVSAGHAPSTSSVAVELDGTGSFYVSGMMDNSTLVGGQVHVVGTATSARIELGYARFNETSFEATDPHVLVDGTLTQSYFHETFTMSGSPNVDFQPIRIGGANAGQLKERPNRAVAGDFRVFDGDRYQFAQLVAQQAEYLVGPADEARYTSIQAAIDQAVTDGHGNSNPVEVWVLDGTYVEDIALEAGVFLRAVNGPMRLDGESSRFTVTIDGQLTAAKIDAGSTGYSYRIQGIQIKPTIGGARNAIAETGTAKKSIYFYDCLLSSDDGDAISFGGTAQSATVLLNRCSCSVFGASKYIATIPSNAAILAESCSLASLWFNASARCVRLNGGTFSYKNGSMLQPIEVLSGSTGSQLTLFDIVPWFLAVTTSHVIANAALSGSSYRNVVGANYGPIIVTGAHANTFGELPLTNDGAIWRYKNDGANAKQFLLVRNNFTATADPGATNDSTEGYAVGSWWFRTDTKEWFICNDATATAAVWREVGVSGGGTTHVDTVDPGPTDDQTKGFDPGEFWLNTADRDLFVCLSSATGAAVWLAVPTGRKVRLQTTDATSTLAAAITLNDPETALVDVFVTARRTDGGTDHAAYQRKAVAYRNGGGATLMGLVDTTLTRETDAAWDVGVGVNGNDVEVSVQGGAGQTVEWRVRYVLERM